MAYVVAKRLATGRRAYLVRYKSHDGTRRGSRLDHDATVVEDGRDLEFTPETRDDQTKRLDGESDLAGFDLGDRRLRLPDQLGELGLGDPEVPSQLGESVGAVLVERAGLGCVDTRRARGIATWWNAWPEGVDEHVKFPGGTWRVVLVMPVDLAIIDGPVDPLLFLVTLADGAAKVEDKVQELVTHCRNSGKTWTQIGQALGMTKQSAWERFSGED